MSTEHFSEPRPLHEVSDLEEQDYLDVDFSPYEAHELTNGQADLAKEVWTGRKDPEQLSLGEISTLALYNVRRGYAERQRENRANQ